MGDKAFWWGAAVGAMLFVVAAMCLSGCVTDAATVSACPTISTVSPELRARIADETERLPADSALGWVVGDWIGLRDQVRACASTVR